MHDNIMTMVQVFLNFDFTVYLRLCHIIFFPTEVGAVIQSSASCTMRRLFLLVPYFLNGSPQRPFP